MAARMLRFSTTSQRDAGDAALATASAQDIRQVTPVDAATGGEEGMGQRRKAAKRRTAWIPIFDVELIAHSRQEEVE
jgi:hypothetical protein